VRVESLLFEDGRCELTLPSRTTTGVQLSASKEVQFLVNGQPAAISTEAQPSAVVS